MTGYQFEKRGRYREEDGAERQEHQFLPILAGRTIRQRLSLGPLCRGVLGQQIKVTKMHLELE